MMMKQKQIIEGIILDADYGFGLKYKDPHHMFLKLEIQQFDGTAVTQLFAADKVPQILKQFKNEYGTQSSLSNLHHHRLYLLKENGSSVMADAIAMLPPEGNVNFEWIYNNNWD